MKRHIILLLSMLLLSACYRDLGTYSYIFSDLNEVYLDSITFSPQAYQSRDGMVIEVRQPTADVVKRIDVHLVQRVFKDIDKLDFLWKRIYDRDGVQVTDTVNTKGYVELDFPANKEMNYNITLVITDLTTTLKYYKALKVKTRPLFRNSLFVLHGEPGKRILGNVEHIGDKVEMWTNVLSAKDPDSESNTFAKAIALAYSPYIQSRGSLKNRALGIFYSDGNANLYDPYGLTQKFANEPNYVLPVSNSPIILKQYVAVGNYQSLNNGQLIIDRIGRVFVAGYYFCFVPIDNNVSPNNPQHEKDYTVTTGTILSNYILLWDSKHSRFLYQQRQRHFANSDIVARKMASRVFMAPLIDAKVDFSSLGELTPVGRKAIYAYIDAKGNDYATAHPFFIFKDEHSGYFYLYELISQLGDKDGGGSGDEGGDNPAFAIKAKLMTNFRPGDNLASIAYSQSFSTNYIFYAEGSNIYRYNTSNGELYTVYSAPADYTVALFKFRTPYYTEYSGYLSRYMDIALQKDGQGAITSLKLSNAGDVDGSYTDGIQDGGADKFGPIVDIQFVHDVIMEPENTEEI